jgi:methyl-accepting chemotaxis protein
LVGFYFGFACPFDKAMDLDRRTEVKPVAGQMNWGEFPAHIKGARRMRPACNEQNHPNNHMKIASFDTSADLPNAVASSTLGASDRPLGAVLWSTGLMLTFVALYFWMQWGQAGGWSLLPAMLAGAAALRTYATLRSGSFRPISAASVEAGCPVMEDMQTLDQKMLRQLDRAVGLSETSSLQMIQRVTGLRALSAKLMSYLSTAHNQSAQMQAEIERNGAIIGELAGFVNQLPQQIANERQYLEDLVSKVRRLSSITDSIRRMARQTEILSINAAIAAASAGEAGRAFGVLAGEVRRLALQSNESAREIESTISHLVDTVSSRSGGEFAKRLQHNEAEAARLLSLTDRLDEGYLDMRQFYAMLLTAITEHNGALDRGITELLDTAQYQDVFKQIVGRIEPTMAQRHELLQELILRLRSGNLDTRDVDGRANELSSAYDDSEALHRDPDAASEAQPGEPGLRIELF